MIVTDRLCCVEVKTEAADEPTENENENDDSAADDSRLVNYSVQVQICENVQAIEIVDPSSILYGPFFGGVS